VKGLRQWLAAVARLAAQLQRLERLIMSTQADVDALNTRLSAAADAITTGLADIRQDIADLKAANPGVDTAALEATVQRLEQGAADVTELDSENPAAAPVETAP
jgi:prefoldin subunit 5